MSLYEHMLIARQDISAQQVDALATHLKTIIETEGGKVEKQEYWGLRSLSYRIKKNRKGHYMLLGLEAAPAAILEAQRQLSLHEDVLRELTVRIEAIDEAPSAILSRRGDDRDRERSFRGPRAPGRFSSGRRERGDEREEFRARSRDELDIGIGGEE